MKKAAILLAAAVFVMLAAPAAFADHRPGHDSPPACQNSQGQAPVKNKHCYPPGPETAPSQSKKSFEFPQQANDGSVTIGMLIVAGLGAFTVMLAARGVRRRLVG